MDKKSTLNSISSSVYSEELGKFAEILSHVLNPDAHHSEKHKEKHSIGGSDELKPEDIGAGKILRKAFISLTSITVKHNFGVYPIVQVIEATSPSLYGIGSYGSGNFGVNNERKVITPEEIIHKDIYTITITFTQITSGEVILIG